MCDRCDMLSDRVDVLLGIIGQHHRDSHALIRETVAATSNWVRQNHIENLVLEAEKLALVSGECPNDF